MYRISVRRGEHYLGYKTITKTCEAEASREIKRKEKKYIYTGRNRTRTRREKVRTLESSSEHFSFLPSLLLF